MEQAGVLKESGNAALKANNRNEAIKYYEEGIVHLEAIVNKSVEELRLLSVLYSNLAHVRMLMGDSPIEECRKAADFDPSNVKAYFRAGKYLITKGIKSEALGCIEEGLKKIPGNADLLALKLEAEKIGKKSESDKLSQETMQTRREAFIQMNEQWNTLINEINAAETEKRKITKTEQILKPGEFEATYVALGKTFIKRDISEVSQSLKRSYNEWEKKISELNEFKQKLAERKTKIDEEWNEVVVNAK
jgi:tetratricopeptide (TPR) repeat protein